MSPHRTNPPRVTRDAALIDRNHDVRHEYLRRDQAARFLGLAPGTMANLASCGRGPAYHRVGRTVLYAISDLRQFVAAGRVETTGVA